MSDAQDRLREAYRGIVSRLGVHPSRRPLQFERHDDGSRHFEPHGKGWEVVTTERGGEFDRRTLPNDEEALFLQTSDLTWSMASDFERANRIEDRDCRELISKHQVELMNQVSLDWGARVRKKWEESFRSHPLTHS